MNIVNASVELLSEIDGNQVLKAIELAGRTCYKSEDHITDTSCTSFVKMLIARGHEAMLEHYNVTFKLICNRGVTHEVVRHRIASYAQESTRYCNYSKKGISYINPCFWSEGTKADSDKIEIWLGAMTYLEEAYNKLVALGAKPEEARDILPNALKTELVVTMNIRELRHFLKLRTSKFAHPQMRQVAIILLIDLVAKIPVVFDDIYEEVTGNKIMLSGKPSL